MATFKDMNGLSAEIVTVGFKDYPRIKHDSARTRIYRVGSGECRFWVWAGVCYATKREAFLDYATPEANLQAWIENKIRGF